MRAGRARWGALGAMAVAAMVSQCRNPATEIVLRVQTDMAQGACGPLQSVRIRVVGDGGSDQTVTVRPGRDATAAMLPAVLGITPSDASAVGVRVEVTAIGAGEVPLFTHVAHAGYAEARTVALEVFLAGRCVHGAACAEGTTCGASGCEPVARGALPDWNPNAAAVAGGSVHEGPLRPRAPSSQTVVYGQRPVFQWAGEAARGVAVELCSDRACERVERALRPTGRCALSDADLAEGLHFWRVRAEGVAPSPVWSFTVARAAGRQPSAAGHSTDVDGDGLADAVAFGRGQLRVWRGGAGFPEAATTFPLQGQSAMRNAGDVDGDGTTDVFVWDQDPGNHLPSDPSGDGRLFRGGARGIEAARAVQVIPMLGPQEAFVRVAVGGDIDGDGYSDLTFLRAGGGVEVSYGGPDGRSARSGVVARSPSQREFFATPESVVATDLDADGHDDVVAMLKFEVLGPTTLRARGLLVLWGAPEGLRWDNVSVATASGYESLLLGYQLVAPGDLDGDGFNDVVALAPDVRVDSSGPPTVNDVRVAILRGGARTVTLGELMYFDLGPALMGSALPAIGLSVFGASSVPRSSVDVPDHPTFALVRYRDDGVRASLWDGDHGALWDFSGISGVRGMVSPGDLDGDGLGDLVLEGSPVRVWPARFAGDLTPEHVVTFDAPDFQVLGR